MADAGQCAQWPNVGSLGRTFFPELASQPEIYLNGASRSTLPAPTLAAGLAALRRKAATPWDIGDTEADADEVRRLFAQLIGPGASASDVSLAPSCAYAMSLAAQNLAHTIRGLRREVLVLQDQNPSNVMPWQQLCATRGGLLRVIARPADDDWTVPVLAALRGGRVAIAALPPCHWCDGSFVDLVTIAVACRACGTPLVVDATQSIGGAAPIDYVSLNATFVAASVHKWLLGPYGCCLCYSPARFWQQAVPLDYHDRNRAGAETVECLPMDPERGYPMQFQPGARRLDTAGRPSFIVMPMLVASLGLLTGKLSPSRTVPLLALLSSAIAAEARALGFGVPARHSPNIVGLRPAPGMPDADHFVQSLARRSPPVLVSARLGLIRVSPHVWNTPAHAAELVQGLREALDRRDQPGNDPPKARL
jgi:selenocysteine lyase/cysteine desulfurase